MNSIIKKSQVQYEGHQVRGLANLAGRGSLGCESERSLRLVEVSGVARAIEVSCSCGDTFMIELEYEEK
ncbi:MAG: hypothetical protein P1V81_12565 [Planctomycetota bacterium]|nr:hypothetical protein [Planctomycetota bacterium]